MSTNKIEISGRIKDGLVFNHEYYGEKFYVTRLEVVRSSGNIDTIPLLISDSCVDVNSIGVGSFVVINGTIRTRNVKDGSKKRLQVYILPDTIDYWDNVQDKRCDINNVVLEGALCKPVSLRSTPQGREICDISLAVHRPYGRTDYVPCIAWGNSARNISEMNVGTEISIAGRFQSRNYNKVVDDKPITKVAYEVSIQQVSKMTKN